MTEPDIDANEWVRRLISGEPAEQPADDETPAGHGSADGGVRQSAPSQGPDMSAILRKAYRQMTGKAGPNEYPHDAA